LKLPSYRFSGPLSPREHLPEKAPTAQLTRIGAADRLFSVPLTRITSVPECAVQSVGFLWGSATVSRSCGVFAVAHKPLTGPADPAWSTRYRNSRRLMTTFRVTQRHRGGLPAQGNSAPCRFGTGLVPFSLRTRRPHSARYWLGSALLMAWRARACAHDGCRGARERGPWPGPQSCATLQPA
jgi:hypothetical protein